jgi:hypothetical protein
VPPDCSPSTGIRADKVAWLEILLHIGNSHAMLPMTPVAVAGVYLLSTPVELGPNAGHQARRTAGARHERTLAAVACMPWFGGGVAHAVMPVASSPRLAGSASQASVTTAHAESPRLSQHIPAGSTSWAHGGAHRSDAGGLGPNRTGERDANGDALRCSRATHSSSSEA